MKNKTLTILSIALISTITFGCIAFTNTATVEDEAITDGTAIYEIASGPTTENIKRTSVETKSDSLHSPQLSTKPARNANLIRGKGSYPKLARQNVDDVFIHGFKEDKSVALTFDDGPDNILTPKLLDELKKYDVKASFFIIGNKIDNATEVLKRADKEGHLILNHSYTHPEFRKTDKENIKKEILEDEDKIYSIIGKKPAIVRPPYGSVDQRVINTIHELNYKTALWSIDTLDWQHMDKQKTVNTIMHSVKNQDIILMHMTEAMNSTLDAVPEIIEKLKAKGYNFVTIDKMLDIDAYK
jgi:peptidoglycan/xylan/chitin deacetylase (PgdA/CDA1 family)